MTEQILSPLAQQLRTRLTAPKPDHKEFVGPTDVPDIPSLTRDELGAIWGAVDRAHYNGIDRSNGTSGQPLTNTWDNKPAYGLALCILGDAQELGHWPRMTDEQMQDYLARSEGGARSWQRALGALAWRADPHAALPEVAVGEFRRILGEIGPKMQGAGYTGGVVVVGYSQTDALFVARSLQADGKSPEALAVAEVFRQTCPDGRYTRRVLELLLSLSKEELRQRCWPFFGADEVNDERYQQLDSGILRDATEHLEAIHRGEVPYVPYKAFTGGDVEAIVRAFVRCAQRAEPWLDAAVHTIQTLAAFPPDGKAKSMPSQTLACRVAEQVSLAPTRAGIESLKAAAGRAINATVKRTLELRLKQAKTALGLRPDVVLAMAATEPPSKKQATLLAKLLQSSYCTGLDFTLTDWRQQLLCSSGGAEFTQALIWLAETKDATPAFAFMATEDSGLMNATDALGEPVTVPETARVRLWHPLHAPLAERRAWQLRIRQLQIRQPLRQAFREYYEPLPDELERPAHADVMWDPNRSERFADLQLSLKPLLGLARGEGWKIESEGLVRKFGDITAIFELSDEIHPGMEGDIESMALNFWRVGSSRTRRVPCPEVPPLIYSEASRAADLLVSVSAYAYVGSDSRAPLSLADVDIHLWNESAPPRSGPEHPRLRRMRRLYQLSTLPIADMVAMRRRVLEDAFAQQVQDGKLAFEQRSAKVGDLHVHLSTGKVSRDGVQIEIKLPHHGAKGSKLAALPWVPYDEALLEKLVATIATLV